MNAFTFTCTDGRSFTCRQIHRDTLEEFDTQYQAPEPPLVEVQAFGGSELLEDYDDPKYRKLLNAYYASTLIDRLRFIEQHCNVESILTTEELELSREMEIPILGVLSPEDQSALIEEIWYRSTVTHRGLVEASKRFDLKWMGKLVIPGRKTATSSEQPLEHSQRFFDYQAAMQSGLLWEDFCNLTGYRQSEIVAFYWLQQRLQKYLQSRGGRK